MKPATIRRFDQFYLAWVVLTVVDFYLQRGGYIAEVNAAAAGSGAVLGSSFVTVVFVLWTLFMLLVWYLVSRRRSVVGKWIVVALVILGIFGLPNLFRSAFSAADIVALLSLVASVVAAYSLFGAQAKAWFARGVAGDTIDEA